MHVVPGAYGLCPFYIIVGYVHAAGIGDLSIDDDDLPVVTVEDVVQPGKCHGLELMDFNSLFTDGFQTAFPHWPVVAGISEAVEDRSHFNAFLCLCGQTAYQFLVDGVIAEVEVFQVNTRPCLIYCFKQVVELLLSSREQGD